MIVFCTKLLDMVMAPWQDGLQTEELKLNSHSLSIDVSKMSVVVPKLITSVPVYSPQYWLLAVVLQMST